jgi:hypothetical protein
VRCSGVFLVVVVARGSGWSDIVRQTCQSLSKKGIEVGRAGDQEKREDGTRAEWCMWLGLLLAGVANTTKAHVHGSGPRLIRPN